MKLVAIETLIPASYNPRRVDPERLQLVKLSLQKLGWLLSTFATQSGELLSGHQRTHVARDLSYQLVPCEFLPDMDDRARKAINILFNRSTNDMDIDAVPAELHRQLQEHSIEDLAAALPDRPDCFPCMDAAEEPVGPLLRANEGRWIPYAKNVAVSLRRHGIIMPVIVDPAGIVINGIGRLQDAAEQGAATVRVIHLTEEQARFAAVTLNLLSMEFAACFLCMMFMPPARRGVWLQQLVTKIKPGGALVIFDKFEPHSGYMAAVMMRLALAGKIAQGVPAQEILDKELSLAGVQRPLARSEIPAEAVEIFRFGDFAGWIIEGR